MGKNLAEVARIHLDMVKDRRCTRFLSFPARADGDGAQGGLRGHGKARHGGRHRHHLRDS